MKTFKLVNADTDSITFCKATGEVFSNDEQKSLIEEINTLLPEKIKFEADGYFKKVIVLKAKNYILWDPENKKPEKRLQKKGSALKSSNKEVALKEMQDKFIQSLLKDDYSSLVDIYHSYLLEALNVKDINRWSSKKTITEAVLDPERTNEQKVLDALDGTEYSEGDKRYFFFKPDGSLCLVENFTGEYDCWKLMEKVWKTTQIFANVVDASVFQKLHLKTKRKHIKDISEELYNKWLSQKI